MNRLIIVISLVPLVTGCADKFTTQKSHTSLSKFSSEQIDAVSSQSEADSENKVIIYHATIELVVENSESENINSALDEIAKKYEGYTLMAGNFNATLRVKAENINDAIHDISLLGSVKQKVISGEDVSDTYHDLEMRLANAEKARERYLELLSKAENVEAALKVEKELERLNQEIDSLKGQLQKLEHLSAYSTISIHLQNKTKIGVLGYVGVGTYKAIKWLFVRS